MTTLGHAVALVGVALVVLSGVGLVRFPDVYTRLNAAAKAAGLGIVLILLGDLLTFPGWGNAVKVVLAISLQLVTVPVGSYALGRAAANSGTPMWRRGRPPTPPGRGPADG